MKTICEWEALQEFERLRLNKLAPWPNALDICPFCYKPIELEETHVMGGWAWGSSCCDVTLEILDNLDVFLALPGNLQQIALEQARSKMTYIVRVNKALYDNYDYEATSALDRKMERLGLLK